MEWLPYVAILYPTLIRCIITYKNTDMDKERVIEHNNGELVKNAEERTRLLRLNNAMYTEMTKEEVAEVTQKLEQRTFSKEEYIEHMIAIMQELKENINWEAEADVSSLHNS